MKTIVLISCVKSKIPTATKAKDLYMSPLFKKMWKYAESTKPDAIYILSAEHHLLDPEKVIEPYEKTLLKMSTAERKAWSNIVFEQLKEVADVEEDLFVFLAGMPYRKFLVGRVSKSIAPLEGLGIGRQLHKLDELVRE